MIQPRLGEAVSNVGTATDNAVANEINEAK